MLDPAFFLFAQALCKNARKRYCYHAYKHPYKGICRADLPLDIKGHTAVIPDILFKHDIKYYSENKFDGGNKTASDYSLCDKTKGAHTVLYGAQPQKGQSACTEHRPMCIPSPKYLKQTVAAGSY